MTELMPIYLKYQASPELFSMCAPPDSAFHKFDKSDSKPNLFFDVMAPTQSENRKVGH